MTESELQAGRIVLTAVSPFVVGIIAKDDLGRPGRMPATGTAVQFKGLKLILTACHVLRNSISGDLFFLPPPQGGFQVSQSLDGTTYTRREAWNIRAVAGDREKDIAAIVIEGSSQGAWFDVEGRFISRGPGTSVAICGYPEAKAKPIMIGELFAYLALPDFQGATILDPAPIAKLKPFQFAIDYPNSTGILPSGYSGSMVWYDQAGCQTVEQLQQRLALGSAGIVTDHAPSHQALFCTRSEDIVQFLDAAF
jgi:hypothetical protein